MPGEHLNGLECSKDMFSLHIIHNQVWCIFQKMAGKVGHLGTRLQSGNIVEGRDYSC